ncbi:MAG: type II secretion system protein GspN [Desulfobulbaceae bacterium]
MKRFLRWLTASLGYLLYTTLVLALLFWLLLPGDSIRDWLENRLNAASPDLRWEIGKLAAALPPALVASKITVREEGEAGLELLQVAELRLMPDLRALLTVDRAIPFRYRVRMLDGTIEGKGVLPEDRGRLRLAGEAADLQLKNLTEFWNMVGRTASGILSGSFQFEGAWQRPAQGLLEAELHVADGNVSLQQPVFGLDQLAFGLLTGSLELREGVLTLAEGRLDSGLLAGEFGGSVVLRTPLVMSTLAVEGALEPRPELLSSLRDKATVTLIRNQLSDNKLSFVLNGSLLEPGIQFRGTAGIIDGIITGGEAR